MAIDAEQLLRMLAGIAFRLAAGSATKTLSQWLDELVQNLKEKGLTSSEEALLRDSKDPGSWTDHVVSLLSGGEPEIVFVGPPGAGKTSIVATIADVPPSDIGRSTHLGKNYLVRLGGIRVRVHDFGGLEGHGRQEAADKLARRPPMLVCLVTAGGFLDTQGEKPLMRHEVEYPGVPELVRAARQEELQYLKDFPQLVDRFSRDGSTRPATTVHLVGKQDLWGQEPYADDVKAYHEATEFKEALSRFVKSASVAGHLAATLPVATSHRPFQGQVHSNPAFTAAALEISATLLRFTLATLLKRYRQFSP